WTLLQSRDGNGIRGRAWTKTAVAADAGANVTVTTSLAAKSVVGVAAYRSTGAATVAASAIGGNNTSGTSHAAPEVTVAKENSWLVSNWTAKWTPPPTDPDLKWTLPNDTTSRTTAVGTNSGNISGVLGDSGNEVATGVAAARTATPSPAASRSVTLSVVIAPGDVPEPANEAPTAEFTAHCTGLTCEFDASGSSDPDNDNLTYSWDFGDGKDGTGVSPTHTYASDGQRKVTLTVSDGTHDVKATRDVNPAAAVSQ